MEIKFHFLATVTHHFKISFESAKKTWDREFKHPLCRPLLQLKSQQLEQAKKEYSLELQALVKDRGIWNDITTFFAIAEK